MLTKEEIERWKTYAETYHMPPPWTYVPQLCDMALLALEEKALIRQMSEALATHEG